MRISQNLQVDGGNQHGLLGRWNCQHVSHSFELDIGLPSFEGSENWRDKYRVCCYQVLYILWNLHWSWSFTVPTSSGTRREVCGVVSHLTNDMLCMLCMRITLIPEKKLWKQGCWWWWIVVVNGGPRQDSEGSHPTNEYFQLIDDHQAKKIVQGCTLEGSSKKTPKVFYPGKSSVGIFCPFHVCMHVEALG